jgi:hypothetical protein
MSEERLKFLGRRTELELKKRDLSLRIERLIDTLRNEADPMKPIPELRADAILSTALDLADACDRHKVVLDDLRKIMDILGR